MTEFTTALDALGLAPRIGVILNNFSSLFLKWNRSINLSAARSAHAVRDQIVDSLHVVPHVRAAQSPTSPTDFRVLDVGAGGGLPAVVVAACLPDAHIVALEPVHKKHAFLRTAARELGLNNLEPLSQRLEDHVPHDYDVALSRATFDLLEWLTLGLHRVRPHGVVLGFEAIPRSDLPPSTQHFPYLFADKSRAIVSLQSSQESPDT
jgi:16S rRNA (guanine527-N7)-methyltransferase